MKSNPALGSNHAKRAEHPFRATRDSVMLAITLLAVVPATLTVSACTSMLTPLGAEYYDCNRKENPSSPYCHSFRSVANGTNAEIPDSRYDATVRIADVDRLAGIAPTASESNREAPLTAPAVGSSAGAQLPRAPQGAVVSLGVQREGAPVRVAPLVQRTWVKRHVEQGDRLVGSTYLYTEVTRAHWEGYAESSNAPGAARDVLRPHLPDDDASGVRAAANTVNKTATGIAGRVKSSLSQPGVAAPAGEVVAPPIDGASMPQ
jgi:hypothetical protein